MAKKKEKFIIENKYYLSGPLALVAFFLMDVIGGFNFPGYSWTGKIIPETLSSNANSLVIATIFCVIYALLTVFAGYCVWKFFSNLKINKLIKRGIKLFVIAAIVMSVGMAIFAHTEMGTFDKIIDHSQIVTKDEVVQDDEGNMTDTQEVIDTDATAENFAQLGDDLYNPFAIGSLASAVVSGILFILAMIFILVGGFKKQGKTIFSAVAIFCLVLFVYSVIAVLVLDASMVGVNSRFSMYAVVLFMAFLSSYVYVTNIEE